MSDQVWLSRREYAAMEAVVGAGFEMENAPDSESFDLALDKLSVKLRALKHLREELTPDSGNAREQQFLDTLEEQTLEAVSSGEGTTSFSGVDLDAPGKQTDPLLREIFDRDANCATPEQVEALMRLRAAEDAPKASPKFFEPSPE